MAKPKYGRQHQLIRAALAPQVAAGLAVCWRCGKPIAPDAQWDLGHSDDGKTWMGPEHARECNRRAAALKRNLQRRTTRPSRAW